MHILLIGYSRIARKRIIDALKASGQVARLDIASKTSADVARVEQKIPGQVFDSYNSALEMSHADIVYISLINSMHAVWAEKALVSGRHVIIDKPACTSYSDAQRLTELAKINNLLLAEANVFPFHPQMDMVINEFRNIRTVPTRVTALFSFPPLQENDFRYHASCGGGAFNDLGPYAISTGTVFFNEHPHKIFCQINCYGKTGVEIAFSITAVYSEGRSMVGHFGFDTEYQNTISILGPSLCIRFDRVFTVPADYANTLYIRRNDRTEQITVPPADCCINFFNHIFAAYKNKQFNDLYDHLLLHAKSLDMLKRASEKG
jgi:predicted dehydrogenase